MSVCSSEAERASFQEIERTVLFRQSVEDYTPYGLEAAATQPGTLFPLLMTFNGRSAGVVTVDCIDDTRAAVRGVGIAEALQGQGHGRELLRLAEAFARARNVEQLCVNADPQKTGFYSSLGFIEQAWGDDELMALCRAGRAWPTPVQMIKRL